MFCFRVGFLGGFLGFFLDKISELNWYIVGINKHGCKEGVAGVC